MLTRPEPGADVRTRVGEAVARYLPGNEEHRRDLRVIRLLEVLAETDGALTAEMRLEWHEHRVSGIRQLLHHLGVEADSAVTHPPPGAPDLTPMAADRRPPVRWDRDVVPVTPGSAPCEPEAAGPAAYHPHAAGPRPSRRRPRRTR